MSHVTHMNESCYTYELVMSHISMSHVTHMRSEASMGGWVFQESCHTCECVVSHIWMSHVTHINVSCQTYGYRGIEGWMGL